MIFAKKEKDSTAASAGAATIIGVGVTFTGDMNSTADIRVDGTIRGNITCTSRVLVGPEGFVEGNLDCNQADIMGKMKGNVVAKELLFLHGKAFLEGDIFAANLQVEPPANFNGRCYMNAESQAPLIEMNSLKQDESRSITNEGSKFSTSM